MLRFPKILTIKAWTMTLCASQLFNLVTIYNRRKRSHMNKLKEVLSINWNSAPTPEGICCGTAVGLFIVASVFPS